MRNFVNKFLFAGILSLCIISSCKKDNDGKEGFMQTISYQNSLTVPVEMRLGVLEPIFNNGNYAGRDTVVNYDTITINAGKSYETSQFVCTKNCYPPGVWVDFIEPMSYISTIIIGDRIRKDTSCSAYMRLYPNTAMAMPCEFRSRNIYDDKQWQHTNDNNGNTIKSEYTFDNKDVESVQ